MTSTHVCPVYLLLCVFRQTRCEARAADGEAGERCDEEGDAAEGEERDEPPEDVQRAREGKQGGGSAQHHQQREQGVCPSAENGLQTWPRPWKRGYFPDCYWPLNVAKTPWLVFKLYVECVSLLFRCRES